MPDRANRGRDKPGGADRANQPIELRKIFKIQKPEECRDIDSLIRGPPG